MFLQTFFYPIFFNHLCLHVQFIGATMGSSELQIQTDNGLIGMPSNFCCVVVEYLAGGNLKSYLIKNRRRKLAFKIVIQLALDLARGYLSIFFSPSLAFGPISLVIFVCNYSILIHLVLQAELSSLSEDCP